MPMTIAVEDPATPDLAALIRGHLALMSAQTPEESVHALDIDALRAGDVTVWSVREASDLLGCGAMKEIERGHGEIKSMHTAERHRGRGVAARLVEHILREAESRGYRRLSLETGSTLEFEPARALYAGFGFEVCAPFGDYVEDPLSTFMTRAL